MTKQVDRREILELFRVFTNRLKEIGYEYGHELGHNGYLWDAKSKMIAAEVSDDLECIEWVDDV